MQRKRVYAEVPVAPKKTFKKKTSKGKITSLTKAVRQIQRSQELKWFDTILTSFTSGTVYPLNNIPLGDDQNSRDGIAILMKAISIRCFAATGESVNSAPRIVIVYDKANNGLLPAPTDIFTSSEFTAQYNDYNKDRFKIVYDNATGLHRGSDPYQPGTGGARFCIFDEIPVNLKTKYADTGSGTTAGTRTGALYLVYLSTGGSQATVRCNTRVRYLDS